MREKNNEETREKIERKRGRNRRITEINENQLNKKNKDKLAIWALETEKVRKRKVKHVTTRTKSNQCNIKDIQKVWTYKKCEIRAKIKRNNEEKVETTFSSKFFKSVYTDLQKD